MSFSSPDGRGGPHAFVADLHEPILSDSDRHHFQRVLRLREGDPLTVADGTGRWREAIFGPVLQVNSEVYEAEKLLPEVTVGFTPTKGDRPEWVVQKLTELGVDHILVLRSDRSVVRWEGERATKQIERLRVIAREAAMQSRRCTLPTVEGIFPAIEAMTRPYVARAERGGADLNANTILIGPEGGWSEAERQVPASTVDLGENVLRAETAALVAGVYLTTRRRWSL